MHGNLKKNLVLVTLSVALFISADAQNKKHISLKDSLDGKLDLSDYVIEVNGFIPVATIITEPAFGGFGLVLAPIFIKKRPPYIDTIKGKAIYTPVQPDITGGLALFTANGSWGGMGFRSGTLLKSRIKYLVGGGYLDMNLSFYKTFPEIGEQQMEFNIQTVPIILQGIKRIGYSRWYAGLRYMFMDSKITFRGDPKFDSLGSLLETKKVLSELSGIIELDNRDNIFTPDRGIKLHVDGGCSNEAIGSNYDFWEINYYSYMYRPLGRNVTGGLRIDGQQTFGAVPFYLLPYLDMRGLPVLRYQGQADLLTEAELRWDFRYRWSIMLYSGIGKAFDDWNQFGSADWINTIGTGFRYLIARKFGLRMGVDVARGPEQWAYYIVFGSNWLK